jgi:hypothetical protein
MRAIFNKLVNFKVTEVTHIHKITFWVTFVFFAFFTVVLLYKI